MGFQGMAARVLFTFSFLGIFAVALETEVGEGGVSRVVQRLGENDGRPSGVTWVVQLSDLHISLFYPERAQALEQVMAPIISMIHPSLVLVTGDLTDAQNKDGSSTQQYEEDWIRYREVIDVISQQSAIKLERFYDLRGNHDKFGVPYGNSSLDYYLRYSVNARQHRTGLVQSITLLDESGGKNLFVGVDDSMSVGLRDPSNLFAHPVDQTINDLDRELSQWDNDRTEPVTKIVFGHFPHSFAASSESGRRTDHVMTKHNVSAYVNGHLHCGFGRKLYKHHLTKGLGEFWEWEMGDWRVNRMMRVLAIDHGRVSFVEVDLKQTSEDVFNGEQLVMPTIILPTSPVDSRIMLRSSSFPPQANVEAIRALVFSKSRPTFVTAEVFDSGTNLIFVDYNLLDSLRMELVSGPSSKEQGGAFFYEAVWDSRNYTDSSPTRYWLQIKVIEGGVSTTSSMWPFSADGKKGRFSLTFLAFVAIGVEWEIMYPVILWLIIFVLFGGFLLIPRLVLLYMEGRGIYDIWAFSMLHPTSSDSRVSYVKLPLWALLEGARNGYLWLAEVLYIAFLLTFPWLWGRVIADDYPLGYMTLWGWTVWPSKGAVAQQSGVGWPDIMQIVLPYMLTVVVPLVLLISALCAEQAACQLVEGETRNRKGLLAKKAEAKQSNGGRDCSIGIGTLVNDDAGSEEARPLLGDLERAALAAEDELESTTAEEKEREEVTKEGRSPWSFEHRTVRKMCFVLCVAVAALHLKLCLDLASSYGPQFVFLSPIYVWTVPTLIVASILMTSQTKPRKV